jgi:ribosomal protein S26
MLACRESVGDLRIRRIAMRRMITMEMERGLENLENGRISAVQRIVKKRYCMNCGGVVAVMIGSARM